jgi:tRNA A-37 threonylcarbamoyl transferase component Bud32/6-phosphogluconolactonase (cycloisomerase 2 family)
VSDEFSSAFSEFGFGSQIAGYRLEEQIGQGGMAVVYRAYDPRLDRRVALKILAPRLAEDEAFRRRFIRESRAAAAVDHPNIIPVFEAGGSNDVLFIAMRFVLGGDVRRLLDAAGPLPPARVADITSQVASALDAAHARGLVHRDVKPGNILLDQTVGSGHRDHVYLSDFGLSKQALAQTALTSQGQFLGTLDYIAPEQVEGHDVDGRADLYALACAAFELLTGAPPFRRGEGLAVVWAKLSEPPPLLSQRRADLPATADGVMNRALAKDPAERYAGCGEFAAALRDGLGLRSADSGATPRPPVPRAATEIAMPAAGFSGPPAAGTPAPQARPAPAETVARAGGPAAPAESGSPAPAGAPAPTALSAPSAASSGPPTSAGPSSAPAAPPAQSASAGPPTEAAQVPRPGLTRPGLTEPTPPVPPWPAAPGGSPSGPDYRTSSDFPASRAYRSPSDHRASGDYRSSGGSSPRDYRQASGASSWPGGPGGAGTVIAPPAPRPSWWRSRAVMATAAVVAVVGVVAAAFAALHHGGTSSGSGGGTSGGGVIAAVKTPVCTTVAASADPIPHVSSATVTLGGNPFGVVVTHDGKYSFVARGNSIAVLNNNGGSAAPTQIATVPASGAKKTEAITSDGRYLLAVTGSGAYVIDAIKAEDGDGSGAVLGTLSGPPGNPSNEVMVSSDNEFAFITFQNDGDVAVFNLQQAIAGGFGHSGFKGMIELGAASDPQGMAESPDGHWLYVTGESQDGRLYVVDLNKAETDQQHALHSSAATGCGAARVIVSADGSDVWVTDRDSNALVAFSASELVNHPSHSMIARVGVGQTPLGVSFINGGREILVADANLHNVAGADNLALISTQMALQGKPGALRGFVSTGRVPRDFAAEPGGHTVLSTDYGSGQMQAVEVGSLP